MKTKPTAGPWESFYNEEGTQTISAGQNQELIIAEVFPTQGDNDDSEANAALIAAAPEMLEALYEAKELIAGLLKECDKPCNTIELVMTAATALKINNAIKKAEGKQ